MEIKYIKGDLFADLSLLPNRIMVPHVVNNVGRFGSGFAAAVMKHFPIVRERYMDWGNPYILGDVQFVHINDQLTFANMVGQSGTVSQKNPKPIKYVALVRAMERVASVCEEKYNIICPLFGAGLAKGNWNFIEELINEIWIGRNIPVSVYYLEDSDLP